MLESVGLLSTESDADSGDREADSRCATRPFQHRVFLASASAQRIFCLRVAQGTRRGKRAHEPTDAEPLTSPERSSPLGASLLPVKTPTRSPTAHAHDTAGLPSAFGGLILVTIREAVPATGLDSTRDRIGCSCSRDRATIDCYSAVSYESHPYAFRTHP